MAMTLEGFQFEPPQGFRTEELTVGMRQGGAGDHPSPSLIVQTRIARKGATLESITTETLMELAQTVGNMKNSSKGELTFDDGGIGMVLSYSMASGRGELRQYFVVRLHQGRVCTATLTVPMATLNEAAAKLMMKSLSSIRPS